MNVNGYTESELIRLWENAVMNVSTFVERDDLKPYNLYLVKKRGALDESKEIVQYLNNEYVKSIVVHNPLFNDGYDRGEVW